MPKSFYAQDLTITIDLIDNVHLIGLFKSKKLGMLLHEFKGLYCTNGSTIDITFFINWKLQNLKSKAFTAFKGVIDRAKSCDILHLDWLLVFEDEFEEDSASSGSIVLTSNFRESQFLSNSMGILPFPVIGCEVDAVNN